MPTTAPVALSGSVHLLSWRRPVLFGEVLGLVGAWLFLCAWVAGGALKGEELVLGAVSVGLARFTIGGVALAVAGGLGAALWHDHRTFPEGELAVGTASITSTAHPGGPCEVPLADVDAVIVAGGPWGAVLVVRRRRHGLFRGRALAVHGARTTVPLQEIAAAVNEAATALPAGTSVGEASRRWAGFEDRRVRVLAVLAPVMLAVGLLRVLLALFGV